MEELRKRWEVPSVAHFVSSFYKELNLPEMHVEEFENALLASSTLDGSDLLHQLLASLLSGFYNNKDIKYFNYESSLQNLFRQKWQIEGMRNNPLESSEFRLLSLQDKVDILYALCQFRLEAEDVGEATKALNGEDLRIEPVGEDSEGFIYWNFNDERLYKEKQVKLLPEKHKHRKNHREKDKRKKGKHRDAEDDSCPGFTSQWSLICSTEEDWLNLLKKLKSSHHKQDKRLKKIIKNDFLPLIPEIIQEKEKALKKRLLELMPKRESERLARKRGEVEEQKSIMAELDAKDKEEQRRIEAEKRRLAEEKRKREIAEQRDERIRAREQERIAKEKAQQDRAMRALMREHRIATGEADNSDYSNSNSSSDEETDWEDYIHSDDVPMTTQRTRSKRIRNSHSLNQHFGPREYEKINRILYQVQRDKNAWPFLEPVTKEIAPDYFDIIQKPMDISVIRKKSNQKQYDSKQDFIDDFTLIVDNCIKYNGMASEYGAMAVRLKQKFDVLIERAFPPETAKPHVTRESQDEASQPSTIASNITVMDSLSESSDSAPSEEEVSSDESYGKRSNINNNRKRTLHTHSKQNIKRRRSSDTGSSEEETSDFSCADDDNYNDNINTNEKSLHNGVVSNSNSLKISSKLNDNTSPGRIFGIASRTGSTQPTLHPNLGLVGNASPSAVEQLNNSSNHSMKADSVISLIHSYAAKPADVSKWITKPPKPTFSVTIGNNETSRTQQPFQELFAQLKRTTSTDSSNEALSKR